MAEPTSAAITRYTLVDNTTTVLEEKRKSAIPKKTQQDTKWCVKQWNDWVAFRNINKDEKIPCPITAIPKEKLSYFMERFVIKYERKTDLNILPQHFTT